ncbi:MAG: pyruvate carboxyltransferase [Verrucomicrobia bacterium]|nr:pyruvate carboxyltransferase [Verrucomicrobiota bacterium]
MTKPEAIADGGPDYVLSSFPRGDFPKYRWASRPESLPAECWTTETTHRDGQQGGLPLSAEHGIKLYEMMCTFTGNSRALRQAEFFAYRPADRAALAGALERWKSGAPVEPTTWIRAAVKDVELIRSLGVRETGMLASISDYHTFHKFTPGGRKVALQNYQAAVQTALDAGIRPRLHLEDATRAPLDVIAWFVDAVLVLARKHGDVRVKFRICDTLGVGLPYDDVEGSRSIPRLFERLKSCGVQGADMEFHPHNDTWMVVPNCLAAIRAGCGAINGTLLGKGERTGNAPLEAVLLHLVGMGYFPNERPDFTALNTLAEFYRSIGHGLPATYPLFGRDAHRTRAGIHADGLNKFWWMYAPFDVPKLLGRPLEVSLTKDSGPAGIVFLLKQHLGMAIEKTDPKVIALNAWVLKQFDEGRQTSVEWEEIEPMARESYRVRGDSGS